MTPRPWVHLQVSCRLTTHTAHKSLVTFIVTINVVTDMMTKAKGKSVVICIYTEDRSVVICFNLQIDCLNEEKCVIIYILLFY